VNLHDLPGAHDLAAGVERRYSLGADRGAGTLRVAGEGL
jgi:hypothetical protein